MKRGATVMIQHREAERLLQIIASAARSGTLLTYTSVAEALGRPADNARMVAQVCDLLDAAAALAGLPLLALTSVKEKDGMLNRKAWAESPYRDAIFERSARHKFTIQEYESIVRALAELEGMGNKRAWKHVKGLFSPGRFDRFLAGRDRQTQIPLDAIDDLGSDAPPRVKGFTTSYARDPNVRRAVMQRANGRCEYCAEFGFVSLNGERYLECHHIIALANDGSDRMTNVIALCADDHRKAHYSEQRSSIEQEMIDIVKAAESR
jgi:hypothetical protein